MALTPNDNQAFLREVDEDLRRDQLQGFFTRWGRIVVAVVGLALALLAAGLWWRSHREAQAGVASEQLAGALNAIEAGQASKTVPVLAALADARTDGYRAQARLTQAAVAAVRNDPGNAGAQYAAIAADGALPQATRDLALVRGTALGFDALPPASVIARLRPLAVPGNPWFGSAGEMTVAAYLKMNRPDLAGPLAAAIARDPQVPLPLRGRIAGIATSLGRVVAPIGPGGVPGGALKE